MHLAKTSASPALLVLVPGEHRQKAAWVHLTKFSTTLSLLVLVPEEHHQTVIGMQQAAKGLQAVATMKAPAASLAHSCWAPAVRRQIAILPSSQVEASLAMEATLMKGFDQVVASLQELVEKLV